MTRSHGVHGFTDTHREAFRQYAIRQVHIAYDNDKAGGSIGGRAATGRTGRLAGGVPPQAAMPTALAARWQTQKMRSLSYWTRHNGSVNPRKRRGQSKMAAVRFFASLAL
ncbi:hypothetical protein WDV76_16645 [Xenorhabdus griffiniae]|uniref:hypothetical protein n=1 Tax=Xenorhabdus griffiniae TaxID=351672 RepID=UPI0030D2E506